MTDTNIEAKILERLMEELREALLQDTLNEGYERRALIMVREAYNKAKNVSSLSKGLPQ